jgi:hypothetical protein
MERNELMGCRALQVTLIATVVALAAYAMQPQALVTALVAYVMTIAWIRYVARPPWPGCANGTERQWERRLHGLRARSARQMYMEVRS